MIVLIYTARGTRPIAGGNAEELGRLLPELIRLHGAVRIEEDHG